MTYKEDDIELLLEAFRPYVYRLRALLIADGFDPCVRDTVRTFAEAERNALRGTGSAKSIHCDGAAADFICQKHGWDCLKFGCRFFERVGFHAKRLGLIWGGDWTKKDFPHVQCVPATRLAQGKLRALKTWAEKNEYVKRFLKPLP